MSSTDIKEVVKEKYGQAALRVKSGGSSCCGATAASGLGRDPITSNLYDSSQAGQVPQEAMLASLGCGNPTALAKLNAGEVVLDLGSGGGVDVLLSARRVGPTGKAVSYTHLVSTASGENGKSMWGNWCRWMEAFTTGWRNEARVVA